ncbi:hypothetical protein, partial [Enterobacter ludwigii]|uniref:hypothetical protein n=1 Tax=Enterobacter ludwigii TaxID=299767 RepID=UPI001952F3CB
TLDRWEAPPGSPHPAAVPGSGLSLNDFIREIDLEGRKFLAVALIDKRFSQCTDRRKSTD